jgi:transposase
MSVLSAVPADGCATPAHREDRSAMPKMPCLDGEVILGVDTHADFHAAVLIDPLARVLASRMVPATRRGHRALLAWARGRGTLRRAGVEGTGSYGASLARVLALEGIEVVEVTRAARKGRRHLGKTDIRDAEAAARSVLAGEATAVPKPRNGSSKQSASCAIRARARSRRAPRPRSFCATSSSPLPMNSASRSPG